MTLIRADRVVETSTTTGTGAFTLAGAVTGYQRLGAVMSVGDTCYYMIEGIDSSGVPSGEWEAGFGTYSALNTLTRTTVKNSSNSNLAVSFSTGTKRVMISITASDVAEALITGVAPSISSGRYLPADSMQFSTGTGAASANIISFLPFSRKCHADAVCVEVTTGGSGSVRAGLYSAHPTTHMPYQLIEEGTPQSISTTGIKAVPFAAARSITELVWLAVLYSVGATFRLGSVSQEAAHFFGLATFNDTTAYTRVDANFTYAALPSDTSALTMSISATTIMHALRTV